MPVNEAKINFRGFGSAIVQISCSNFVQSNDDSSSDINVVLRDESCYERLLLSVSVSEKLKFPSKVAVVKFELPSGYKFHPQNSAKFLVSDFYIFVAPL